MSWRLLCNVYPRYAPKRRTDEGAEPLPNSDAENERRVKFSYAVAEMIAMAPHTKQLLLQVRVWMFHDAVSSRSGQSDLERT